MGILFINGTRPGDVIVSERDLPEQLRKRPDAVVTALNLLLNEQKGSAEWVLEVECMSPKCGF